MLAPTNDNFVLVAAKARRRNPRAMKPAGHVADMLAQCAPRSLKRGIPRRRRFFVAFCRSSGESDSRFVGNLAAQAKRAGVNEPPSAHEVGVADALWDVRTRIERVRHGSADVFLRIVTSTTRAGALANVAPPSNAAWIVDRCQLGGIVVPLRTSATGNVSHERRFYSERAGFDTGRSRQS